MLILRFDHRFLAHSIVGLVWGLSIFYAWSDWESSFSATACYAQENPNGPIVGQTNPFDHFDPATEQILLSGRSITDWDSKLRERGWILRDNDGWHLWYTGYNDEISKDRFLGYATSTDGLSWARWPSNPLNTEYWIEDMCVVKRDGVYYMFAEGRDDIAHLLISTDRVTWIKQWDLDIRQMDGQPIESGPRGTPTAWFENGTWWLFYERRDLAVYAATSRDLKMWTNISDEPILARGPEPYDLHAVAIDQIIKIDNSYYAFYHASALPQWGEWSTCLATSKDLIHWQKSLKNPILPVNAKMPGVGSATAVHDGMRWRLYTTHPDVRVYFAK